MKPPSPSALPIFGHIPAFRRDPLGLIIRSIRSHGDIVRFRLGPRPIYLVNHPDAIHHVLKKNASNYDKDTRSTHFISAICGETLLTTNGEKWKCRRNHFQPAFHRQAIEGFSRIMQEEAAGLVTRWRGHSQIEASAGLMATTFRVVARSLFGAELREELVASLEAPITQVLNQTFARLGTITGRKPLGFSTAMQQLTEAVDAILSARTDSPGRPDLLELIRSGAQTPEDVRNEAIAFLLAGHETTANALTWLLAHLAHHPEEQSRSANDPASLDRSIQETLRLSPPIWIIERHAIESDEIEGYSIPCGSSVVVCPYTVHRHPDFWDTPESFLPDRFLTPPPAAFLPFGLGPRVCIGKEFSLMEARIIASALLSNFNFTPTSSVFPEPAPAVTLRVRGGLPLNIEPRSSLDS
jgi:cytochrome P450